MANAVSVNISEKKGTMKRPVDVIYLEAGSGARGDAHAEGGLRQVSLLAAEDIRALELETGLSFKYGAFAENITTNGIDLSSLPVGTLLRIGRALTAVTQIGKTCHEGCEISKLTGKCIMPKRGIFVSVLEGGEVKDGDNITVEGRLFTCALLVASDKASKGERIDGCEDALRDAINGVGLLLEKVILPDEEEEIANYLADACDSGRFDVVFTSGGTGLSLRDVTPEATKRIAHRDVPGIAEAMRAKSLKVTDRAMLSRAVAVTRERTLVINLPGSPKAVGECVGAIIGALPHAVGTLRGEAGECARK